MFRLLWSSDEADAADPAKNFAVGFEAVCGEEILAGEIVAIDTTAFNKVVKAASDDVLRRAVCGIALEAGAIAGKIKIACMGRVAAAVCAAGAVKGDVLFTTATDGAISDTAGAGAPFAIGTALADEAAGVVPVWIGPTAAA